MAGTGRGQSPDLIQELIENPQEFDFFQAVRLIEMYVAQERNHPAGAAGSTSTLLHRFRMLSNGCIRCHQHVVIAVAVSRLCVICCSGSMG